MTVHPTRELLESTVRVEAEDGKLFSAFLVGAGSGVDVLITAAHCVQTQTAVRLRVTPPYEMGALDLTLQRLDDMDLSLEDDVAVFRWEDAYRPRLGRGHIRDNGVTLGEEVVVAGFPQGLSVPARVGEASIPAQFPLVRKGVIAGIRGPESGSLTFLDLLANPGYSGAPFVWKEIGTNITYVAGMVVQTATDGMGVPLGFSVGVPADRILKHLDAALHRRS